MKKITFFVWLKKQQQQDNIVGDLAYDVCRDKGLVKSTLENNKKAWVDYLESKNACHEALEALDEAWQEYEDYLKFLPCTKNNLVL